MCCKVRHRFAKPPFRNGLTGSIPVSSAKLTCRVKAASSVSVNLAPILILMYFNINVLENFFKSFMPATKKLIEDLWNTDRPELVEFLNEYTKMLGASGYGYQYMADMKEHAKNAPHEYTDPWKSL